MSIPSDQYVGEKLQEFVDKFTKKIQEKIDAIMGAETDNQDEPLFISNSFYAICMIEEPVSAFVNEYSLKPAWMTYLLDINVDNNTISSSITPFFRDKFNDVWTSLGANADDAESKLNTQLEETFNIVVAHEGEILVYYGGGTATVTVRYGEPPANHDSDVYKKATSDTNTDYVSNRLKIDLGELTYTIDENNYISTSPVARSYLATNYTNTYALKSYPFLATCDDSSTINTYITRNNSSNNYHSTYTTTGGDTIDYYYGDNYFIIKNNGHDTSYDDIRNMLDISMNKIVEDNPDYPAIKVPTYKENKYGPDPDDDIEVDMPISAAAYGDGLTHYYICNAGATVLNDISAAMSAWDINNTGKDLYKNLISCRFTKIGSIPAENSTFSIYGEELLYNGSPISINKITGNPTIDLGEYEILPKFNDFRDYAPYTKIEMFIPYCGWVALPSHCMSSESSPKIITGTLITDIIAATCKAIIKCNDTVVAEAAGFTAIDIPFVGENVGMKMAGIANSMISYGKAASGGVAGILSGAKGGSAGAGAAAAGGLVGIAGSYAQMAMAENANYTEICGKTGDGCQIGGLGSVYIKIQRPKTGGFKAPDFVPAKYAHTTGFLCMKERTLGECSGFTVCTNPDLSGLSLATDAEKAEIKRILETGIIINEAPE